MNEREILSTINGLLEESDYPLDIKDINDLEEFLNDESNMRFEQYAEIGRLYDELIDEPDEDRYSDY